MSGSQKRYNQEFCLDHVKFEVPIRHPSGNIKLGDIYTCPEKENLGLEMANLGLKMQCIGAAYRWYLMSSIT
jgi:hypothetical protein